MYNWSTDEQVLARNKEAHTIWRLEQLVNFGLNGEKIPLKSLKKILGPTQYRSEQKKIFTITAGRTLLAEFYYQHRYSDALDFFSEAEFDVTDLTPALQKIKHGLGATKIDYQSNFNRNLFFLHLPDEIVKLKFTYFPFTRIESGRTEYGLTIDSIIDIAANKLFTIYQRTSARKLTPSIFG